MSTPRVAALGAEHGDALELGVEAVDRVGVRRAEQQRPVGRPDRAFGELEAAGHALDLGALAARRVELERGGAHPDVVARRGRDRPVDAEHGERNALARPRVAREHDAVGGVEAGDHLAAGRRRARAAARRRPRPRRSRRRRPRTRRSRRWGRARRSRSGMVTAIRYQLKHTRPFGEPAHRVLGRELHPAPSRRSRRASACGSMS